eukprot:scaffold1785_cov247-Pinguiococcus_pyrenoidosus.AAC.22
MRSYCRRTSVETQGANSPEHRPHNPSPASVGLRGLGCATTNALASPWPEFATRSAPLPRKRTTAQHASWRGPCNAAGGPGVHAAGQPGRLPATRQTRRFRQRPPRPAAARPARALVAGAGGTARLRHALAHLAGRRQRRRHSPARRSPQGEVDGRGGGVHRARDPRLQRGPAGRAHRHHAALLPVREAQLVSARGGEVEVQRLARRTSRTHRSTAASRHGLGVAGCWRRRRRRARSMCRRGMRGKRDLQHAARERYRKALRIA